VLYTERTRQIALLTLGSSVALSLFSSLLSLLLSIFAPHLGWKHNTRSLYTRIQILLVYSTSILLLAPAIANLVFVAIWRRSSNPALSSEGRCRWDIDILWSGNGFACDAKRAVPWGYLLAGSVVRLALTASIIVRILRSDTRISCSY
jgi:hypothetical protein